MNKLLTKIVGAALGLSMTVGVGVAVASQNKNVTKANATNYSLAYSFDFATASDGTTTTELTTNTAKTFLNSAGNNIVDSVSSTSKCYKSKGSGGTGVPSKVFKMATGSAAGSIVFDLLSTCDAISKIEMHVYSWPNKAVDCTINEQNQTKSSTSSTTEYDLSFEFDATRQISISVKKDCALSITTMDLYKVSGDTPAKTLSSIAVSGSMTNTTYITTESWNPAGLIVTATYDDESQAVVTNSATWTYSPASPSSTSTTSVVATASYTEGGVTKTASSTAQAVTVTDKGASSNPYTVAEAIAAVDAGQGITDVYVKGIISKIVTAYNSSYGNVSFNFSEDGKMSQQGMKDAKYDADGYLQSAKMEMMGNEIEVTYKWENGRVVGQKMNIMGQEMNSTRKFNEDGSVAADVIDMGGQKMESPYTNYKFDSHGNWISRTGEMMGQSMEQTRTIEYYE